MIGHRVLMGHAASVVGLATMGCAAFAADERRSAAEEETPVVAVYRVDLATPKTELHFGDGAGVRDLLVTLLKRHGAAEVFDWARMGSVVAQRVLDGPALDADVQPLELGTDFHLTATLTYAQEVVNSGRALSKSKALVGDAVVELILKDSRTNLVVATTRGTARQRRKTTKRAGFGAASRSTVSSLSGDVVEEAMAEAVEQLVRAAFPGVRARGKRE